MCFTCELCGLQEDAALENNMKVEVTGKLKKHFNASLKESNGTTAAVSVIMVSTWTETLWAPSSHTVFISPCSYESDTQL